MRQLILAIAVAIAAVIFALQNSEMVTIRLFFWDVAEASQALVLLVTLVIGLITGLLFMAPGLYRKNRIIQDQKKRIDLLENRTTGKSPETKAV